MPWDGAGSFNRTDGTRTGADVWSQAKAAGRKIVKEDHDLHDQDLADGLESTLNRFGENAMAANLAMGGFKATGLGVGSSRTDGVSLGQTQDGSFLWGGVSSGENVVAISLTPAISAYTNGMRVWFQKNATPNTTSMAININGIGQKSLMKAPSTNISAREMAASAVCCAVYIQALDDFIVISGLTPEIALPRGHLRGFILSQDTDADHDILVSVGSARDESNTGNIVLATEITKRIDAVWSVGDNAGGLDGGSVASDSFYGVFLIKRVDTGVVDVIFSSGSDQPTMPTNYTLYRQIGWVRTDGSANIVDFVHHGGDRFLWAVPVTDFNDSSTTTAALQALTVPPSTRPIFAARAQTSTSSKYVLLTDPSQANTAPTATLHNLTVDAADEGESGAQFEGCMRTNSSRQIRHRASATVTLVLMTFGWLDDRGLDA